MRWVRARPESEIIVATHSAWLFTLLNTVIEADSADLSSWFLTGELAERDRVLRGPGVARLARLAGLTQYITALRGVIGGGRMLSDFLVSYMTLAIIFGARERARLACIRRAARGPRASQGCLFSPATRRCAQIASTALRAAVPAQRVPRG